MRGLSFFALAALALLVAPAAAQPIDLDDFSGSETVIDFTPGFGYQNAPFTYEGVTFSESGGGGGGPGFQAYQDWSSFFDNIVGSSQGNGFNDHWGDSLLRMEFSTIVRRVGLLMSTGQVTTWTLRAYDTGNSELVQVTRFMPSDTDAVFLGVRSPAGIPIAYITIDETNGENGYISLVDDLRFEAVPEPGTFRFALLALAALGVIRRR